MTGIRKKSITAWLFVLVLTLLLSACGGNKEQPKTAGETPAAGEKWSVQHELGAAEFTKKPEKIVVLDMYLLDIALGLGLKPAGIASEEVDKKDLPGYMKAHINYDFTWVGGRKEPSMEIISSIKPDLILADVGRHKDAYAELSKIAPTMVVNGSGAEDWKKITRKLGEALKIQDKAEAVIAAYDKKLAEGKQAISKAHGTKVVPLTLYPKQMVRIYTPDSYTGSILKGLGLELPFSADGKALVEVNVENLLTIPADAYIRMQSPVYTKEVDVDNYDIFKDLKPVKEGKAYTVSMEDWTHYRGPVAAHVIIDEAVQLFSAKQ